MSIGSTTAESGAVRFSRQVVWTMGTRLLIAASSMLGGVIVARWMGASGVGVLAALSVISMLAISVGGLGLPSSITFLVARDTRNTKPVMVNAAVFGLTSGVLLAVIVILIAAARPGVLGSVPTELLTIAVLALPVQMLTTLSLAIYLGLERIRAYNLIDLSLQGIILVNAVVTLVLLGLGLFALVTFAAAANIIVGLTIMLLLVRAARTTAGAWRFDGLLMREMLTWGLRFFVAMAAGLIILRGDLLIVNYFRGSEEAGVYAVSTQIATFLHMMPNVISTLLFPRTSGAGDESGHMTCRVTRHAVFIIFILCLAAIPMAFILPILYGPAFSPVPMQFLILLPGVFLLGIETIQVQYFTGLGLPRLIPVFWIVTLVLNVGLNLMFIPSFGAAAAAATSTISYVLIFVLVSTYFFSKTGRSFSEAFIIRRPELRELLNVQKFLSAREGKA